MSDSWFAGTVAVQLLVLLGTVFGAILGGWIAWTQAPPIGGDAWVYIHVAVTIFGAIIGAKVGAIVLAIVGVFVIAVLGVVFA